ncbi:asparaginase family protein [Talaromyces proteolyticus]|uniref:Asparaginase family protein n=1 Tax=Talaromyces proteolyticus TaxID=1131652 RepID=A0AAD4L3A4_9EURO|nr:asparaginase family protein [Talaromyces proteolyticus]KAH8705142.1 asparaginase family protein [Talaromyces proteolyticus]
MSPRGRNGGDICAIYVHAGAGFHSYQNERLHLDACNDAAKVAMTLLKNGGSALDAVEAALRLMEDREITNAGYGSNLTAEGTVECDATIVDHHGRSGAVGACSFVKNPISVARLLLNCQNKPLPLQRVPPNFLVGQGATDFAYDHGLSIVPGDYLVSPTAKTRWLRWQHELEESRKQELEGVTQENSVFPHISATVDPAVLMTPPSSLNDDNPHKANTTPLTNIDLVQRETRLNTGDGETKYLDHGRLSSLERKSPLGRSLSDNDQYTDFIEPPRNEGDEDGITDTIGAIAIDCYGNVAAGSSSGGIGMKHRGRIGPAALIGIGTAVIPVDPLDPEQTSVAAVTSGTGEHIGTTLAASTCATRIYYSDREDENGMTENVTEEEAIKSMVDKDFMEHPGVKHSHCEAAIGVMAVKKMKEGLYLFFCHNTDSFALASMTSEDKMPRCVMSRRPRQGTTAQGGRFSRYRR